MCAPPLVLLGLLLLPMSSLAQVVLNQDINGRPDTGLVSDHEDMAPDDDQYVLDDHGNLDPSLPQIHKRDLEFNQYVPAYRLRGEPSCEELRAMWRLSKREARRATTTNNLPRARPYTYGRLIAFAPSHNSRPIVFGKPTNYPSKTPITGRFNKLRDMLGPGAGRPGSLQRLHSMVAANRMPGESSKGKYDELRDLLKETRQQDLEDKDKKEGMRHAEGFYQQTRRTLPLMTSHSRQRLRMQPQSSSLRDPGLDRREWSQRAYVGREQYSSPNYGMTRYRPNKRGPTPDLGFVDDVYDLK